MFAPEGNKGRRSSIKKLLVGHFLCPADSKQTKSGAERTATNQQTGNQPLISLATEKLMEKLQNKTHFKCQNKSLFNSLTR